MKCKVCGCTEETPCEGGCFWIGPELCSACITLPESKEDMLLMFAPLMQQQCHLKLPGVAAFQLLAALQLALRHPDFPAHSAEDVIRIAEALQEFCSKSPALAALCQAGWRQEQDVPVQEESRIILPG